MHKDGHGRTAHIEHTVSGGARVMLVEPRSLYTSVGVVAVGAKHRQLAKILGVLSNRGTSACHTS